MSENPENQVVPEPSEETPPGGAGTQPPERQEVDETAHPAEQGDTSLSDLRQSLAEEESAKTSKPGGLVQRITDSLRRGTGPLRKQSGPLKGQAPAQEPPAQQEMADDFLSGRLGGATAAPPDSRITNLYPPGGEGPSEEPTVPAVEPGEAFAGLGDSGLFGAEEESYEEPDWMAAIRQEAAEEEAAPAPPAEPPAVEKPAPQGTTGPLRSLITGLFRGEERRGKAGAEEVPDEVVSDRLERSLGAPADQKESEEQPAEAAGLEGLPSDVAPSAETGAEEFGLGEDAGYLAGLEDRMGGFGVENAPGPGQTPETPELSLGDEELLWGEAGPTAATPFEGPTLTPEDIWGGAETQAPEETPARGAPPESEYTSIFMTGEELASEEAPTFPQDQLLREALEKSPEYEPPVSVEDIRAIALENYTEPEESPRGYVPARAPEPAAPEPAAADEGLAPEVEEKPAPVSFRQWLADRKITEKVLIVEAAVVALVLLLAVPFFILTITHGPVAKVGYLIPRPLPADLPYPTGVELPGGWDFSLQKSTFVNGQWKPSTSEWLEGTELRRIVAVPWNPQTEAVIRSFKPGDIVWLKLSNGDRFSYTITQVQRVSITDTQILSDRQPSLVIILYQENAKERWVVFCKP